MKKYLSIILALLMLVMLAVSFQDVWKIFQ